MSTSSHSKPTGAKLVIQRMASQEQEQVYKNGVQKTVHAVVKAHPFDVELAMVGNHDKYQVDFHKFTIECVLVYDNNEEKEVDYIKSSPVDWVVSVNETGERAVVEVKLLALTSQHEYMFFRIKFIACPPEGSDYAPITVFSDPVRVVSKQNQLSKNKKPPVKRGQKRNFNETVVETLSRIEETQKQQQALINTLFQTVALLQQQQAKAISLPPAGGSSAPVTAEERSQPSKKRMRADLPEDFGATEEQPAATKPDNAAEFERHLQGLVSSFAEVSPDERAQTIHKVLRESNAQAAEVIDALWVEGLQREVSRPNASSACTFNPYQPSASAFSESSDYDTLCQKLLSDEGDYFPFYEIPALLAP